MTARPNERQDSMTSVRAQLPIAGAPVSFGVYNLADARRDGAPTVDEILDVLQAAGYDGVDLGPVGLLGRGKELREHLGRRGLALAGGLAVGSVCTVCTKERL